MKYTFKFNVELPSGNCMQVYYGKSEQDTYEVELSDEEVAQLQKVLENYDEDEPACYFLEGKCPEIDSKIREKVYSVAYDMTIIEGYEMEDYEVNDGEVIKAAVESGEFVSENSFFDEIEDPDDPYEWSDLVDERDWNKWLQAKLDAMSLHERAEYLLETFEVNEPEELPEGEYYIPEEISPVDAKYWKGI